MRKPKRRNRKPVRKVKIPFCHCGRCKGVQFHPPMYPLAAARPEEERK